MGITFKTGDMFSENVEAIVNTVNCVGVMGKGVALEFKRRWLDNYKEYKRLCENKLIQPGTMFVHELPGLLDNDGLRFLINFPTKTHWRGKSKLSYIIDGLDDFVRQVRFHNIRSVAVPPLGCGNGGLDWVAVKPLIETKLSELPDVEIIVFEPNDIVASAEFEGNSERRVMTDQRAILVKTFTEMEPYFGGHLTRLVSQKITYFLQALGVDFGLKFSRNEYGPYSEQLKNALTSMEKLGFIEGFTSEERLLTVPASAYSQAEEYLESSPEEAELVIQRLGLLIEGFESPYGMELLATVHFLASSEGLSPVEEVIGAMKNWSERKASMFSEDSIRTAYTRLRVDGLIH